MARMRRVFDIGVAVGVAVCAVSALRSSPAEEAEAVDVSPMPSTRHRRARARRAMAMLVAVAIAASGLVLTPVMTESASAATKVTICHRTHSTTNPYRKITVSQSAAQNSRHGGHDLPNGSANPAIYDNTFTYASNNKYWGDIIPGSTSGGSALGGSNGVALNWDAAGISAFSTYCAPMTAKQFYDVETTDGGQSAADVVADLNDMDANEDEALLASIGGSFSTSNVTSWATAVSVTTSAATSVAATTATVNGSITVGSISTARGFDYGTSSTLATFTSVSAGANVSSVTNQAISANLTGLTAGTTYYFRATGTTNAGTETEGILYGSILSFTTTGNTAQTITFNQPSDMLLGDAAQNLTNTTANTSGLAVTFTSNSTSICTVSGSAVTAVSEGTCSITASQAGDSTYAPATSVTRTFAITGTARTLTIDGGSYNSGGYALNASPPTITSTASLGNTTGTKSYSSSTTGVCTVNASTGVVTFVSAGTCTIAAAITAGGIYNSATASTVSFPLTLVTRTLTVDSSSYSAGGYLTTATPPTITSTASLGNTTGTKSYSSSTTGVCTINSSTGLVSFVSAGTCTIGAAITAGGIYNSANASTISFTLTAPAPATTTTTTPEPTTTTTVPPTTSTTAPPTTTTTAPPSAGSPVVPAADGTVRGVVWFDRNNNTSFDGREWILPGVQVRLTQVITPSATPASTEGGIQAAAFTPAATPLSFVVTTDKDGKYTFTGLPFSQYSVSAVANIKGFDYTSDTDGNADWNVTVSVASPGVPGIGDFAGLGKGEIIGQMFEQQTGNGLAFATIRCMWGGYDDVLGNGDDVPFELPADAEGRFDMAGIPYGNFSCSGVDNAGRRSAAVLATVFSPEPQRAPLPVGRTAALPQTGGNIGRALLVALLSLGLGATLTITSRRHRRQTV
jgi:hypothetical protein